MAAIIRPVAVIISVANRPLAGTHRWGKTEAEDQALLDFDGDGEVDGEDCARLDAFVLTFDGDSEFDDDGDSGNRGVGRP